VDQHLLPHSSPIRVLQVVDLVQDHELQALEGSALLVQHVAEHLGGHDDEGGLRIDGVVAGQQPHPAGAVAGGEVPELLV
jgi:hypothetical protein